MWFARTWKLRVAASCWYGPKVQSPGLGPKRSTERYEQYAPLSHAAYLLTLSNRHGGEDSSHTLCGQTRARDPQLI